MKAVTPETFRSMRSALEKLTRKNNGPALPGRLCSEFMRRASDIISDEVEGEALPYIVVGNGKARLWADTHPWWILDGHLAIGGLNRIQDPAVKEAASAFVSAFVKNNNMFTPYSCTVWPMLLQDIEADEDRDGDGHENNAEDSIRLLCDLCAEDEACGLLWRSLRDRPCTDRATMESRIAGTVPHNDRDAALLALLRDGLPYAFEKRWEPDIDDMDRAQNAYSNVIVGPDDMFPVTLRENPVPPGLDIIDNGYNSDCAVCAPTQTYVLEDDGTLTDIYDRLGFLTFTNKLTDRLNSYYAD